MPRGVHALIVCGLALAMAGSVGASAIALPKTVSVHVQRKLSVRESVRISFRSGQLLGAGYYYAVIVLKPYRKYTRQTPPPCSTSSNMERTDYGYRQPDGSVRLALTPAASASRDWCRGGAYIGAVYAVPHPPPCESKYPCPSETYKPGPCWELASGHRVCGVVALPRRYAYPDGLPVPLATGTRVVGRFSVVFK